MKKIFFKICIASIGLLLFASCAELTLSETDIHVNGLDTSVVVTIDTKVPWTAELSDTNWVDISQIAGSGSAELYLDISMNHQLDKDRSCSITIKTAEKFYVVTIHQTPIQFYENGDLGLSVKWCEKNYGATSSIDEGKRVTGVRNISESDYRQPTKKEYQELFEKCAMYRVFRNDEAAVLFLAENGNGIIFPMPDERSWHYTGEYFYNYSGKTETVIFTSTGKEGRNQITTEFYDFYQGTYCGMFPEVELLRMVEE